MALTATEEAQVKALIAQNAALLSLASSEPTIISKLAATKVSLADLTAASTVADSDLFLVRQGSTEKSVSRGVLASGITPPDASESLKGILEIATAAEAQAFTANKAIDGAKLAAALQGANQSLAASGYQKLPGGLIIQWGEVAGVVTGTPTAITFPIAFPSACLFAEVSGTVYTATGQANNVVNAKSASGITITCGGTATQSYMWLSIGY